MGCVEEGRRVDGEGVGVVTRAVARAKVRHTSRAEASRSETAPAGGKNFGVFLVERKREFVMSKSGLLSR